MKRSTLQRLLYAVLVVFALTSAVPADALTPAQKKAALIKKKKYAAWKARKKAAALAKKKGAKKSKRTLEPTPDVEAEDEDEAVARSASGLKNASGTSQGLDLSGSESTTEETTTTTRTRSSSRAIASQPPRGDSGFVGSEDGDSLSHVPPSRKSGEGPYALRIGAGPKAFGRMLRWNDDIFQRMVGYTVAPALSLGVTADWFPGAHFTDGVLANIGITATFDTAVGLGTRSGTTVYPTSSSGYDLGLQYRLPLGRLTLGAVAGFGNQSFAVTFTGARDALPPDVSYSYLRGGLMAGIGLTESFDLNFNAEYLLVSSAGMLSSADYFPRASVGGIGLGVGVDYNFSRSFAVGISGGLRRFFMDMKSVPGDTNVAGGATDQYPVGQLKIMYRM